MDKKDLINYQEFLEEFERNVIRSLNIKLEISKDRIKAIELLSENIKDSNGLTILSRCLKNEKWFLKIITNGLKKSENQLKEINSWVEKNVKDKETRRNSKKLIEIIELFNFYLDKINERLSNEEVFLKKQDKDSFKKFIKNWKKELKFNRKLLKKAVGINKLKDAFMKTQIFLKDALKRGIVGAIFGAITGFYYMWGEGSLEEQVKTGIIMGAYYLTMFSILENILNIEKTIYKINLEEFKKIKERLS